MFRNTLAAASACILLAVAGSPAHARNVAIDLGDGNYFQTGMVWQTPTRHDLTDGDCGGCAAVNLPFAVNFGAGAVSQIFVYENGFITLGAASGDGALLGATSLSDLGSNVISPGYADVLSSYDPSGFGYIPGEITTAVGGANFGPPDSVSDPGTWDPANLSIAPNSLFDVTWFLTPTSGGASVWYQIQFVDASAYDATAAAGDFDLWLNYANAPPNGLLAGFTLGANQASVDTTPIVGASNDITFKFRSGRLVTGEVAAPAPEPGVWALLLAGFAAVGGALRRRRALTA